MVFLFFIFYFTIWKIINDFSKGAIYSKPSNSGSYQKPYQVNVYVHFLIKTV